MNIGHKHKAAFHKEYGKPLVIEDVITPIPKDEEVLLKTISVGICHSDVHIWKGEASWPLPMIPCHEVIGRVAVKGDRVPENVRIGETAIFYYAVYTEEDKYTRRGLTQHAKTMKHYMGGLQEYILIPHYKFLVNADGLKDLPAAAPLGCAALSAYGAVKKIRHEVEPDDYVAVIGLGGLGIFALQWIKIFVPQVNIIGIDIREEALNFSSRIVKVDELINASKEDPAKAIENITRGEGVKAVIDFVGSSETLSTYIKTLSPLGIYVLVGLAGIRGLTLPSSFTILDLECKIQGNSMGSLPDLYDVVDFARRGRLNYIDVVTKRWRFNAEEINTAFKELHEGKVLGRQVIVFE